MSAKKPTGKMGISALGSDGKVLYDEWMRTVRFGSASIVLLGAVGVLLSGCPKPPPPKLPPKEVPKVDQIIDSRGERQDVITDAVESGSNSARILFDCGQPQSQGVAGRAVLNVEATKCEFNRKDKTLLLTNGNAADCQTFAININEYTGKGTYNTSSLGKLSFGMAKMRQAACKWDGSLCMDWNGASGPHPEASCTFEIVSDGGLAFGTSDSTITGTFVCDNFTLPYAGCPGSPAKVSCVIPRASFSIAGCSVIGEAPTGKKPKAKPAAKRGA